MQNTGNTSIQGVAVEIVVRMATLAVVLVSNCTLPAVEGGSEVVAHAGHCQLNLPSIYLAPFFTGAVY